MRRALLILIGLTLVSSGAMGCGLDWTLPQAHYDGVEEHGYVAYWEKLGEADLGDGLVIPVNINFNSHRESSSPTLGKGWTVALLESHVEPLDDNSMNVIMPDGWTFIFLRNGNTETWRGNAGWVGETNNTVFTITAPCGWRIKFDQGKIQAIDSNKNRTLSYKYNGGIATEIDEGGKAFLQVGSTTGTGAPTDLWINGQKVNIAQAERPRIMTKLNQNLITGLDQSLSQLQWPDGKTETFAFGTDKKLNPTLVITHPDQSQRNFTWNPATSQIMTDGDWTYKLVVGDNVPLDRTNAQGQSEYYYNNFADGTVTNVGLDGVKEVTTKFVGGSLSGRVRSVTQYKGDVSTVLQRYDYDETGKMIRERLALPKPHDYTFKYDANGKQFEVDCDGKAFLKKIFDDKGRLVSMTFSTGIKKTYAYLASGVDETTYLKSGKPFVTHFTNFLASAAQGAAATAAAQSAGKEAKPATNNGNL